MSQLSDFSPETSPMAQENSNMSQPSDSQTSPSSGILSDLSSNQNNSGSVTPKSPPPVAKAPQKSKKSATATQTLYPTSIPPIRNVRNRPLRIRRISRENLDPLSSSINRLRSLSNRQLERPVEYGLGRGKGGVKRMRQVMRKRDTEARKNSLNEIRKLMYLKGREYSIPRLPWSRLVRQIFKECGVGEMKIQSVALTALLDASEAFMVSMFEQCSLFISHAKRVTLMPKDLQLAKRIQKYHSGNAP